MSGTRGRQERTFKANWFDRERQKCSESATNDSAGPSTFGRPKIDQGAKIALFESLLQTDEDIPPTLRVLSRQSRETSWEVRHVIRTPVHVKWAADHCFMQSTVLSEYAHLVLCAWKFQITW